MNPDSQIVIGSDGIVLAATGRLPSGLLDLRLEDCAGLSPEIRAAGKALLDRLRLSGNRVALQTVPMNGGDSEVQLVAIEALAIRRAATDLRLLLSSRLDVIASQAAAADVTLKILIDDNVPPVVHVDADKIAWAVTTLAGNALRYVRAGTRRMPGGTISVRASFDRTSSQLSIDVQDDGPGVPADTVARLFKRDGLNVRGAGLALLLMSDICAAHGGAIEVKSNTDTSGHGTTVRLTLSER